MGYKIRFNSQKVYAFVIVYMLSFSGFLNLINSLLNMIGMKTVLDTAVLYIIMFSVILIGTILSLRTNERMPKDVILVVSFFCILYNFSSLIFPSNQKYMFTSFSDYSDNPLYIVFLYSLPGYVFARKLMDYTYFRKLLIIFSYIIVSLSIIVFLFGNDIHGKQYMVFSYNMLLQLLVLLFHKPQKNKWLHIFVLVMGCIVFAIGGSRGALIMFVFVAFLFGIQTMSLNKKTIFKMLVVLLLSIVYIIQQENIILLLDEILKEYSIESRNFKYMIQQTFLEDSIRLNIYTNSIDQINFWGYGMRGDRVLLDGGYVHNLFIELWINFGWILGTAIILMLLTVLWSGIKNRNNAEHYFVMMLLANGFLALMVSGSYLNQSPAFYILFGFCVNSITRKGHKKLATSIKFDDQ